ncbi:hypothetical protein [Methylobacterium gnaphalii]|uniref:hypothetical protein n=1 Tax=Methylobacterium gnaphalii TaxID=1010610 RepID=UPI0011BE4F40|nr:hypothetical protein [Methylobacterium gnaphalii]GJD69049.1 hypothetical protein MMMDOFMJ_1975 [Methylobacterium gnaphalii]
MTDRKSRSTPEDGRSFSSWKFDIINASNADADLKPAPLRFFMRVLRAMDESKWDREAGTCEARISDEAIADDVPGCTNRHTIQDHRNAVATAAWFTFVPGSGRTPTIYLISDRKVNSIFDDLDIKGEARRERRRAELERFRDGGKRSQPKKSRRGQTQPEKAIETGANAATSGQDTPRVHLRTSPYGLSLSKQDETQDAHTHACRTPNCWQPATVIDRKLGERWCDECAEAAIILDPVPIPARELASSELADPELIGDPGSDYRARSRGE